MSVIIEKLARNRDASEAKSYIIGLERGRTWAEDYADYFEMRWLSELDEGEFSLPYAEESHFRALLMKTQLEAAAYVRGWKAGVTEIRRTYLAII